MFETALTLDARPPEVAGLKVSSLISPRFLLCAGRSDGTDTGPLASGTPRCGVTASGEFGDAPSKDSRLAPFVLAGVEEESSAGKKRTLIFFSWIEDLAVCSMCAHWKDRLALAVQS